MEVLTDLSKVRSGMKTCVTLGMFDGVHLGHQELLRELKKHKKDSLSCVVTFKKHPQEYFLKKKIPLVSSPDHKQKLLSDLGINVLVLLDFDEKISTLTYQEFLLLLKSKLGMKTLVLGSDAVFGKNREGTKERVKEFCTEHGIEVIYIEKIELDHSVISSRNIRENIAKGSLEDAEKLLGRPFLLHAPRSISSFKLLENNRLELIFSLYNQCLPPSGMYFVTIFSKFGSSEACAKIFWLESGVQEGVRIELFLAKNCSEIGTEDFSIAFHQQILKKEDLISKEAFFSTEQVNALNLELS